ncbi:T-lymphoma invasion and metastasis-inducing protein 2-like isoform X2 [Polyodon spathula]|uniref:T-lymphoma invasion and metastasis-inducing protein 2-like isoform X2 n=1 Tax=Polyodon spathula TaxID=7913 RepID=UPI001B7F4E41|nr:T-lymphoma invasion and metastasis-inducing protein 2-like isoform X2 [Polyodon spathula]
MGNSESQYSIQGCKNHRLVVPGKQKPCSLRVRSVHAKDEQSRSAHSWGHASGYKTRAQARSCLSQHKSSQPYSARHYDCMTKGSQNSANVKPRDCNPGNNFRFVPESSFLYTGYDAQSSHSTANECNDHVANEKESLSDMVEDKSSPKVLIKTLGKFDGSLRVEFTNSNNNNTIPVDDSDGPVQLLKYSPTLESTPSSSGISRRQSPSPGDSGLRTSKGSSLSSESSWYDSPWGNDAADLNDTDHPNSSSRTADTSLGDAVLQNQQRLFEQRATPVSLQDLFRDAITAEKGLSPESLNAPRRKMRASLAPDVEVASDSEGLGSMQYSSYTLPCRKSKSIVEGSAKRDTLKSKMRRISDWTGSLTRKKRKLQEPKCKQASECFDSGIDGFTTDTSSPSQVSSLLWPPSSGHALPPRSESSHALHSDALRQNIYENFMRELETGRCGSETETETSSESLGSREQLDLLFQKEQGVVRKAGWLFFKPLVTLHKDKKLELAPRRKWKQYWVTLKGCTLLFYETYGKNSMEQDFSPCYALFAEDSIVQSVPEHPKKENVFCFSNAFGDAYLFQATSQTDMENWVTAIHSASASLFAKKQGKEETVRLLRSQTRSLVQKIDMDSKMRKMGELQLATVRDPKNRKAIENQIQQWEQNLEKFNVDLFRMRCYLASLQGAELPNPKSLLAAASRPSKLALSRLGIFSVSSFHALICSRDEATLRKRSLSQTMRGKKGLFSSLKGLDSLAKRGKEKRASVSQIFESNGQITHIPLNPSSCERIDGTANIYSAAPPEGSQWESCFDTLAHVYLPDTQGVTVTVHQDLRVEDVLNLVCKLLDPTQYCLHLRRTVGGNVEFSTPASSECLLGLLYDELEVFPLNVFHLHLLRTGTAVDFGFAVTGHVDGQRNSRIFVSEVLPDGVAYCEGLRAGDEILCVNEKTVSTLDLGLMEPLFSQQSLMLTLRRDLLGLPSQLPPPSQSELLEEFLDKYPKQASADVADVSDVPSSVIRSVPDDSLELPLWREKTGKHPKSADPVSTMYQSFQEVTVGVMEGEKEGADPLLRPCPRHMSVTERLRKVIQELVDTEKSYVKDLSCLFEIYLKPLQNETFLTQDEMESLFGSLPEMLDFQKVFLQTLEERIASSPDFSTLETPFQFKKLLFSLGGSFLYYADHFKLYSGFCANHIKVQKVLERAKTDRAFKEFLGARNPTKQHSSTLESYLIKPVQRVLKYPLLLRELVSLTDVESEEHYHLTEAFKAMEKVASHINEMQKIYEDYGTVFDQLVAEQSGSEREVTEISMGEFLMHSSVIWLNPFPSLGRMRKDPTITVFVFKKAVILVYRESSKMKKQIQANTRAAYIHGDMDPFKFRWLIPLSALQVRLGNAAGTDTTIWELIHTKSEIEGRPESVFQLCSSVPESQAHIIKVIRSILRENVRRHLRCEFPVEKICKERLVPLRNTMPLSARIGSSRASWLCKLSPTDMASNSEGSLKATLLDLDEGSHSSGPHSSSLRVAESMLGNEPPSSQDRASMLGNHPPTSQDRASMLGNHPPTGQDRASMLGNHPPTGQDRASMLDNQLPTGQDRASMLGSHPPTGQDRASMLDSSTMRPGTMEDNAVKESDILSDDDDSCETGKVSPTNDIEAQLQRLKLSKDSVADRQLAPCVQPESEELDMPERQPMLVRGHYCPIKRKANSLKRNKGVLLAMKEHSRSLDSQSEAASLDLSALLEREFSVQSLASVVNEDCFYETSDSDEKTVFPSL